MAALAPAGASPPAEVPQRGLPVANARCSAASGQHPSQLAEDGERGHSEAEAAQRTPRLHDQQRSHAQQQQQRPVL